MTKALDPSVSGHEQARRRPEWTRIYELLDVLVRAQVIVCPTFENHRSESSYSPFFRQLKWLYDGLSAGLRFWTSEDVKCVQLVEAASAYVESRPPSFSPIDGYITGVRDGWTDRIRFVTVGHQPQEIDVMRESRARGHADLTATFHRWRTERGKPFKYWFDEERAAFGTTQLQIAHDWISRRARIQAGLEQFTESDLFEPPAIGLLRALGAVFERYGVPTGSLIKATEAFLLSEEARNIPFVEISSAMYASIAKKASEGQKAPPNQGTFADVTALATLLPACDAMVIDDKCLATLFDVPQSHRPRYQADLFSTKTLDKLVLWLERALACVTQEHKELLTKLYGRGWEEPNLAIFKRSNR